MSGRGKGRKGKSDTLSRSAGLQFHNLLRKGNYAHRVVAGTPVCSATALDYLDAQVLELSGDAARDDKTTRV